jgi:hypothetical protein
MDRQAVGFRIAAFDWGRTGAIASLYVLQNHTAVSPPTWSGAAMDRPGRSLPGRSGRNSMNRKSLRQAGQGCGFEFAQRSRLKLTHCRSSGCRLSIDRNVLVARTRFGRVKCR